MNKLFRRLMCQLIVGLSFIILLPECVYAGYIYGGTCMEFLDSFQSAYCKRTEIMVGEYEKHHIEDGTYVYYLDLLPEEKESFVRMYLNTGRENDYLHSVTIIYKAEDKLSVDRARTAMVIACVSAGMTFEEFDEMFKNKKVKIQATGITMHMALRKGTDVHLLDHLLPGTSLGIYLD